MPTLLRQVGTDSIVLANVLGEAWASLRSRRLQAALSAFGIATGITAVVLLVSIVSGMHRYLVETIGAAGGSLIQVNTSQQRSTRDPRGFSVTMRPSDMRAVLESTSHFDLAVAENSANGIVRTTKRSTQNGFIRGLTEHGFEMLKVHPARGRLFLDAEYANGSRVAVLGADMATYLFTQDSPIGSTIVVGDWPFTIVGVLEWVGDPEAGIPAGPDNSVYVPFKAVAAAFRGNDNANTLRFRLRSQDAGSVAAAETRTILERLGRSRGETSGEYMVNNTLEQMAEITTALTAVKLVVGLVGGIGLFVGAVGVANVMLVTVRERRQEIGVRRAIGATKRAVFIGFLVEGLAITLSGGAIGIFAAWALTQIARFIPQIPSGARPHISFFTATTAVALLTLVGLVASLGPARRAAAVFPAEALRAD